MFVRAPQTPLRAAINRSVDEDAVVTTVNFNWWSTGLIWSAGIIPFDLQTNKLLINCVHSNTWRQHCFSRSGCSVTERDPAQLIRRRVRCLFFHSVKTWLLPASRVSLINNQLTLYSPFLLQTFLSYCTWDAWDCFWCFYWSTCWTQITHMFIIIVTRWNIVFLSIYIIIFSTFNLYMENGCHLEKTNKHGSN